MQCWYCQSTDHYSIECPIFQDALNTIFILEPITIDPIRVVRGTWLIDYKTTNQEQEDARFYSRYLMEAESPSKLVH
jgi:hypothetical protein